MLRRSILVLHLGLLPLRGTFTPHVTKSWFQGKSAGDMLSCISQSYKSWSLGCSIYILVGGFKHEFYFPFHIWDVILPIDELIFFKMVKTTNQHWCSICAGWEKRGFNVTPRILMILLTSCCCSIRAKSAWSLNSTRPVWLASASTWNLAKKYLQKHRFFLRKKQAIHLWSQIVRTSWSATKKCLGHSGTAPEEQLTNSETKEAELSMELWQMCGTKGSKWVKIGQVIPESPDSMGISWNFRILKWRYCTI